LAIPIPVEEEGDDAVVGGGVNLAGHYLGIRLVLIAP
jgi:hypothetical protein